MNPQILKEAEERALAALKHCVTEMENDPPMPQASSRAVARARILALHHKHKPEVDHALRAWSQLGVWAEPVSHEARLLISFRLGSVLETVRQALRGEAPFGGASAHPPTTVPETLELLAVTMWQGRNFPRDELWAIVDAQG